MRLKVLSVAFAFAPVSPGAVGGAEQILSALDRALVESGHDSVVVASEGSEVAGELFSAPLPDGDVLTEAERELCRGQFQAVLDRACESRSFDLIHLHGMDFHRLVLPADVPALATLHMPVAWYPREMWSALASRVRFQCVSETQRREVPPEAGEVTLIRNGVADSEVQAERQRGDFAAALGRICPEKNVHEALEAGTRTGTAVRVGGQVFPYAEHQAYFREQVVPRLGPAGGAGHEFLGPLTAEQRDELLREAKCLLHPTLAPETSSLVAIEAMAQGTPVIAYRSGALPEIVEDGVTGFLVNNVEEMAQALGRVETISAEACRSAATRRFGRDRMVREYFDLYRELASKGVRESVNA